MRHSEGVDDSTEVTLRRPHLVQRGQPSAHKPRALVPPTVELSRGCGLCNSIPARSRPCDASRAADLVWLFPCRCAAKLLGVKIHAGQHLLPTTESLSEIARTTGAACFTREATVYATRCVKDARAVSNGLSTWSVPKETSRRGSTLFAPTAPTDLYSRTARLDRMSCCGTVLTVSCRQASGLQDRDPPNPQGRGRDLGKWCSKRWRCYPQFQVP